MTRHTHDDGQLVAGSVDYDYVVHHEDDEPGLLVVKDVPAQVCQVCDEYWFDDAVGFGLSRLLQQHEPRPGQVRTISWFEADAA
jgi:YgiT-type zinc finger domain-containing protein